MRIVLFTERNSPFDAEVLHRINNHPVVSAVLVVTRGNGTQCDYYLQDAETVNLPDVAYNLDIDCIQQENLDAPAFLQRIELFKPDILILANYQKKVSQTLCAIARKMAINFHPSPLPYYAGLALFFWMAKNGERTGGVSCCLVADTIDGGDILEQIVIHLSGDETAGVIRKLHFAASYDLVTTVLDSINRGNVTYKKQDLSIRTYFSKPNNSNLVINWSHDCSSIIRTIRAGSPFPGAELILSNGRSIRVTDADIYSEASVSPPGTVINKNGVPIFAASNGWIRINAIGSVCDVDLMNKKSLVQEEYKSINL